jgi:hypothetical protein
VIAEFEGPFPWKGVPAPGRRDASQLALLVEVIERLASRGVATVLLGGSSLDVLVLPTDMPLAIGALLEGGWALDEDEVPADAEAMAVRSVVTLTHRTGEPLALRWRAFPECVSVEVSDRFWRDAEPVMVEGSSSAVLQPADRLVHACVTGVAPGSSSQWLAGAIALVRETAIDWPRVVASSTALNVRVRVFLALDYLRRGCDAPVPPEVLSRFDPRGGPAWERGEARLTAASAPLGPSGTLRVHWYRFRRLREVDPRWRRGAGALAFSRYVRIALGRRPWLAAKALLAGRLSRD